MLACGSQASGGLRRGTADGRGGHPADGLASHDHSFPCRLGRVGVKAVEDDV